MRRREPAHLLQWRQDNTRDLDWWIVWHDFSKDRPAKRRINCRAHGATTREARRKLLDKYKKVEAATKVEAIKAIDHGRNAFDTPLADALDAYQKHLDREAAARLEGGDARVGLAAGSVREFWAAVALWIRCLKAHGRDRIKTGDVNREDLAAFVRWLPSKAAKGRKAKRGRATVAKHARHLRVCIRWLDARRPGRLLRDSVDVLRGLKAPRVPAPSPEAIRPDTLRAFLREALRREAGGTVTVERTRRGKREKFEQEVALPDTLVSRVFVLLAALGCRLSEVVSLTWDDIDLEASLVTVRSSKTGSVRRIPLADRTQGAVAPELVPILRAWKLEGGGRPWVLPSLTGKAPSYSRQAWRTLEDALDVKGTLNPQRLRRSWVSYACACGLSSGFAALLAGHTPSVAAKWYLGVVLERAPGSSMLAAMGLAELVKGMGGVKGTAAGAAGAAAG